MSLVEVKMNLKGKQAIYKNRDYLFGWNFFQQNFRLPKYFVGWNFRHFSKSSPLSPHKVSHDKVNLYIPVNSQIRECRATSKYSTENSISFSFPLKSYSILNKFSWPNTILDEADDIKQIRARCLTSKRHTTANYVI